MNKGTTSRGNPIAHSCRCEVCGNDMDALAASHARLVKALEPVSQGDMSGGEYRELTAALAEAKALIGEAG